MMANTGLTESWETERSEHSGSPWPLNTVLDNVVFTIVFGVVVNEPSGDAGMLRTRLAGTAPGVGGYHYAFPSDCFPRYAGDRSFAITPEGRPQEWATKCNALVEEWKVLARAYESGDRTKLVCRMPREGDLRWGRRQPYLADGSRADHVRIAARCDGKLA